MLTTELSETGTHLPIRIDPCPIVDLTGEVRFQTTLPPQAIVGLAYAAVRDEFPEMVNLPAASLPAEVLKLDPNLSFQPHYRLQGPRGTITVGPRTVAIAPLSVPYPGWPQLQKEFDSIFARLAPAGFIGTVERFGLRYVNFFDEDILPRLTLSFEINNISAMGVGTSFRTVLPERFCKLVLQVGSGMTLHSTPPRQGSAIDIDVFVDFPSIGGDLPQTFSDFLSNAHDVEKRLFFRLLTPELLSSLNPVYA